MTHEEQIKAEEEYFDRLEAEELTEQQCDELDALLEKYIAADLPF